MPTETHDIIIVGAGPVGLFLACEILHAAPTLSVLVLERSAEAPSANPWKTAPLGLRGLNTVSLEALYRRGLLDDVVETGWATGGFLDPDPARRPRFAGHFAGLPLPGAGLDPAKLPFRLDAPSLRPGMTYLATIEGALARRAEALGASIRRGCAVAGLQQHGEEGVDVFVRQDGDQEGGEETAIRARHYLVGADGGRSTVRKAAGIAFPGTAPLATGYTAQVQLAPESRGQVPDGFHVGEAGVSLRWAGFQAKKKKQEQQKQGDDDDDDDEQQPLPETLILLDFDGGAYDRATPPSLQHVQARVDGILGPARRRVRIEALHRAPATWTDAARQAAAYRAGRMLLAGDAAHVHAPLGGQGLNLGLGDAANLGWKLARAAAAAAGKGGQDGLRLLLLLDSYERERAPVAAAVLDAVRAQTALLRPDPHARALRALFAEVLRAAAAAQHLLLARLSGLALRYPGLGEHALVGCSAPELAFAEAGGERLGEVLARSPGKPVLLDFAGGGGDAHLAERARAAGVGYLNRTPQNALGLTALLVRPDGVVAWVAEEKGEVDLEGLSAALELWFGCGAV
ncbi:monooxygenase [Xylariomycetidae sp. FL0641]|nr:monooxygenase [Xylariomycetidae sp. FL0641]